MSAWTWLLRRRSAAPEPAPAPAARRSVGRRLLALRTGVAVQSQAQVAHDALVAPALLESIERGDTEPTLAELVRLAAVLAHYGDIDGDRLLVELVTDAGILPSA